MGQGLPNCALAGSPHPDSAISGPVLPQRAIECDPLKVPSSKAPLLSARKSFGNTLAGICGDFRSSQSGDILGGRLKIFKPKSDERGRVSLGLLKAAANVITKKVVITANTFLAIRIGYGPSHSCGDFKINNRQPTM